VFIPLVPAWGGQGAGKVLNQIAGRISCATQVALPVAAAFPVIFAEPGTSSIEHLSKTSRRRPTF